MLATPAFLYSTGSLCFTSGCSIDGYSAFYGSCLCLSGAEVDRIFIGWPVALETAEGILCYELWSSVTGRCSEPQSFEVLREYILLQKEYSLRGGDGKIGDG